MSDVRGPWSAVVPVKSLASAKSRLLVPDVTVAELALAFLRDVLDTLAQTPQIAEVIVATGDEQVGAVARAAAARVVDDTGHAGINAAVRWAADQRETDGGLLVLVSDLPCLTPAAVGLVLDRASSSAVSFVADADGTGTTMWLRRDEAADGPHFGPGSRAAHIAHGAVDLVANQLGATGPWLPARLDVDTPADLDRARRLGLGPASARVLEASTPEATSATPLTVLRVEPQSVVVTDEAGRVTRLSPQAVQDAGWRQLQAGQRILVSDGRIEPGA